MEVKLLNEDYIKQQYLIAVKSARKCYDSISDSNSETIGEKDRQLMKNLMKSGHHTIFEHIDLVLEIEGISRALLQQWSRHRVQSQNVKSTRYTLDKMLKEFSEYFKLNNEISQKLLDKYFIKFEDDKLNVLNKISVEGIIKGLVEIDYKFNKSNNDKLKYLFPESLKTELISKINLRSFINMYKLRSDKHAMQEFQDLVSCIFNKLPSHIKELIALGIGE